MRFSCSPVRVLGDEAGVRLALDSTEITAAIAARSTMKKLATPASAQVGLRFCRASIAIRRPLDNRPRDDKLLVPPPSLFGSTRS